MTLACIVQYISREESALVVPKCEENGMTIPTERTRSIIQAREFLVDLSRDKTLPEVVRTVLALMEN